MIFIAKNIHAARVNLMMNDYVAGLPGPLSFIGLVNAIVRDLGLTSWSAGVIPVLHQVNVSNGRTKPEMENKSNAFVPIEIMEDITGNVVLSLILDIPECDSENDIAISIMRRRIIGGIIQNKEINVEHVAGDGSAFGQLRRGYAMLAPDSTKPEYCQVSNGTRNSFDHLLKMLFPDIPETGWKIPIAAGYRLLENPQTVPNRACRRNPDLSHVFAEPLVGLAELVSVRKKYLTDMTGEDLSNLFWSWNIKNNLIMGHHAYQFNTGQQERTHG